MPGANATVIATHSRRMRLRLDNGQEVDARIQGKRLKPVCADQVQTEPIPQESDWLITGIASRKNELTRPNNRGVAEVLASNIETLVVVAAPEPAPDWFIIDRYLCAAELMPAAALLIFNKMDRDLQGGSDAALAEYRQLGYEVIRSSTKSGLNLDRIGASLSGGISLVVGQSGVGKSSIINCLSSISRQKTQVVSDKSKDGKHTTVNSTMLPLNAGGFVIDSPGVRDFAPAFSSTDAVASGFVEIRNGAGQCRFSDCMHLREPDCAIKDQVNRGVISARRYESYRRAIALVRRLQKNRY
jgi:ribosome biogenesis GTPase